MDSGRNFPKIKAGQRAERSAGPGLTDRSVKYVLSIVDAPGTVNCLARERKNLHFPCNKKSRRGKSPRREKDMHK